MGEEITTPETTLQGCLSRVVSARIYEFAPHTVDFSAQVRKCSDLKAEKDEAFNALKEALAAEAIQARGGSLRSA